MEMTILFQETIYGKYAEAYLDVYQELLNKILEKDPNMPNERAFDLALHIMSLITAKEIYEKITGRLYPVSHRLEDLIEAIKNKQ
jgi:hypothetical protein